jgi:hypothetical protein
VRSSRSVSLLYESTCSDTHLLDEVDFAVVFAEARANELVVIQTCTIAQTDFLECWPDALEVRGEFVCCIRAWVGHEHSQTMRQEKAGPRSSDHASSDYADCFDCHC